MALEGFCGVLSREVVDVRLQTPERTSGELLLTRKNNYEFSARGVNGAPPSPGVYVVFGRTGGVLYIGEAENMREELTEHFRDQGEQGPFVAHDDLCYFCQQIREGARRKERAKELIRRWRPPGNR